MGKSLANNFDKELLLIYPNEAPPEYLQTKCITYDKKNKNLEQLCDQYDISFLLLQCEDNSKKNLKTLLQATRNLRIPYSILSSNQSLTTFEHIFVPITYLEEEVEKAQFAAAFGRFFNSKILIFQPNDYGSKAEQNCQRIIEFLNKFDIYKIITKANEDSFGIEKEICAQANLQTNSLVLLSASREYGLDDIIFGPKELKLIRFSKTPILLINPRADLYALCD